MKRFLTATVAGVIVVAASYVVAGVGNTDQADSVSVTAMPDPRVRLNELDRLIGVFEERVARIDDPLNQWTLGAHYIARASITGGVADYLAARKVLEIARTTNGGNPSVDIPLASARLGLHDFAGAIELLEPHLLDNSALAVHGDAALGLGDVSTARNAYERLARVAPEDPAITVRLASLEWQIGNGQEAIAIAERALAQAEAADFKGQGLSFYMTYYGRLLFESGQFDRALPVLTQAVAVAPEYLSAKIELAHVVAALGDVAGGVRLLSQVLDQGPDADATVVLGDFLTLLGDDHGASEAYSNLDVVAMKAPDAYRRNVSLFLSNQNLDPARALTLAEDDLRVRQDSGAYDTLAWALYRSGRLSEARQASDLALQKGTSDAAAYFHAGQISIALGDSTRGLKEIEMALDMNPFFNALLADEARQILTES